MRVKLAIICLLAGCMSYAQNIVFSSGGEKYSFRDMAFKVLDDGDGEPVPYASVYLQPVSDTVITHFCITSEQGEATLPGVPQGKYYLNVEMMGYLPYRQDVTVSPSSEIPREIRLKESKEMLDASAITSFLSPVEFLKDTIVYNALAYKLGSSAMLKELIAKMPGLEIKDGKVMSDGKAVNEITVNGRTFFFGDQEMVLSSLPAKIVNKIRIIDRKDDSGNNEALASSATKVMDVELKEEYSKGTFGDITLGGGAGRENSPSRDKGRIKAMGDLQSLACHYMDKNQLTFAANADDERTGNGWLGKLAANYSTTAIRNFNTDCSVIASWKRDDISRTSYRNSFNAGRTPLMRKSDADANSQERTFRASFNLSLTPNKIATLEIKPYYEYRKENFSGENLASVSTAGAENLSSFLDDGNGGTHLSGITVRNKYVNLGKKERTLSLYVKHDNSIQREQSNQRQHSGISNTDLFMISSRDYFYTYGTLYYKEPVTERMFIETYLNVWHQHNKSEVRAMDRQTSEFSPSYSSYTLNKYLYLSECLLCTFRFPKRKATFGVRINETSSDAAATPVSEPKFDRFEVTVSPYIMLSNKNDDKRFWVLMTPKPADYLNTLPMIKVAEPLEFNIGNIYLKPSESYDVCLDLIQRKPFRYDIIVRGLLDTRPVVFANWFDALGQRYAFPVNSLKPEIGLRTFVKFLNTFGKGNNFKFDIYIDALLKQNTGYQSSSCTEAFNPSDFVYSDFINSIWGGPSGSKFYSGESGFTSSRTSVLDAKSCMDFSYRTDIVTPSIQVRADFYGARYSLIPDANQSYWRTSINPKLEFDLPWDLYADASADYSFYRGLGSGLDRNICTVDCSISKDIGDFTVSLEGADLLDKSVPIVHMAQCEYVQNVVSGYLGRTVLLKFMVNFGKRSVKAQKSVNSFVKSIDHGN